jgi:3-isopropylmalate/(R)-2-methylmalate dehydratase small subunit
VAAGTVWKYGDDVNTDVLFPGKYTYTLRTVDEIKAHALEDLDPSFAREVRPGDLIFAGRNFGCGSSREQAVTCLVANGIAAVVAVSFARIFYRNCINNGLPAIVSPEAVAASAGGERVEVLVEESIIRSEAASYRFPPFSDNVQRLLDAGGLIPFVRARLAR